MALVPQLCRQVLVPPAVWSEVTVNAHDAPGAQEVRRATWIEVRVPDPPVVDALTILADRGEAEAIALARMLPGSLLLIDDARARRVAERLELRRIGTLGLLRRAKQAGLIEHVRPQIEALQANGIYVRQALVDAVLREVGE